VKKMVAVVIVVTVSVVLASCSSSKSSDHNVDAWTNEVRVITPDQVGDRQYEEISGLEEQERIGTMGEDNAVSTAKSRLRRRAAELDADAVVIIACGRNVRPIEDDRVMYREPTVVCHGMAIRWKMN